MEAVRRRLQKVLVTMTRGRGREGDGTLFLQGKQIRALVRINPGFPNGTGHHYTHSLRFPHELEDVLPLLGAQDRVGPDL